MTQPMTTGQVPTPLKQGVKKTVRKGGNTPAPMPVVRKPPMPPMPRMPPHRK